MTALDPSVPLPTKEELTVPELNVSSPVLKAGAHHFGKFCDHESKEFMLCMSEEKDPRKCLNEGKEVTSCAFRFFNKIRANCMKEFTEYWKCLDHSGNRLNLEGCRARQKPFDKCVLEKLGWERPEQGYFARVRLHETSRKKPDDIVPNVPEWIPGPRKVLDKQDPEESSDRFGRQARNPIGAF